MVLPIGGIPSETQLDETEQPSRTYRLDTGRGRIVGMTDGLDAIRQLVYKTLRTDRYFHEIYTANYGSEAQVNSAAIDLERWVREALLQDDRISEVRDFVLVASGDSARVDFTVVSSFGQAAISEEVEGIV